MVKSEVPLPMCSCRSSVVIIGAVVHGPLRDFDVEIAKGAALLDVTVGDTVAERLLGVVLVALEQFTIGRVGRPLPMWKSTHVESRGDHTMRGLWLHAPTAASSVVHGPVGESETMC
tara:strand:- start:412 stop:762 length:351 start_codon:yes stop_codon:yes gene_type:complete